MNHRTKEEVTPGELGDFIRLESPLSFWRGDRWVTTALGDDKRAALAAYFLAVASVGIPVGVRLLLTRPLPGSETISLLGVLGLVSYHLSTRLPSEIQINPGFPLLMSALFTHGAGMAILVIVPSALLHSITREHGVTNCLFNAGQFSLCIASAEAVGRYLGWLPGVPGNASSVFVILAMASVYDLVNNLLLAAALRVQDSEPFAKSFWNLYYEHRKSVFWRRSLMAVTAALLASNLGNIAFLLVFLEVLALKQQNVFQQELIAKSQQIERDALTQAYSPYYLSNWIEEEFARLAKSRKPCSFIFLDLDDLKGINDSYGHEAGDAALIHTARLLESFTRKQDSVVRYGGDEFVVICPDTDLGAGLGVGTRIARAFASSPYEHDDYHVKLRVSIGVATWPIHGDTCADVIRMADKAMYLSKKRGGDMVWSASDL